MRVLQIAPEFPPKALGGGGQIIKALTSGLEDTGCELTVLSALYDVEGFFDKPYTTTLGETKIQWLPLIPSPAVGFQLKTYLVPNLRSLSVMLKTFLQKDFDVVHIHGFGHPFCDLAAALSKLTGKPYIYTIHGLPKEPARRGGPLRAIYSLYTLLIGAPLVRGAARITVVSGSLAAECAASFPGEKIEVVSNGIDTRLTREPSPEEVREVDSRFELGGKHIILGLGRLSERKGFQNVIRALPAILAKIPEAHLVIAGKDDGYGYSRQLLRLVTEYGVEQNVSFVGQITDDAEKAALLWKAEVIVIPSFEESFGLVALEAMGCGKPIVANYIDGLSEVLADDPYSLMVNGDNPGQLADALIGVINDPALKREARENRESRLNKYDIGNVVSSYMEIYCSLKTRPRPKHGADTI